MDDGAQKPEPPETSNVIPLDRLTYGYIRSEAERKRLAERLIRELKEFGC